MDLNAFVFIITRKNYDHICRQLGIRGDEAQHWLVNIYGFGLKKYPALEVYSARRRIAKARQDPLYPFYYESVHIKESDIKRVIEPVSNA